MKRLLLPCLLAFVLVIGCADESKDKDPVSTSSPGQTNVPTTNQGNWTHAQQLEFASLCLGALDPSFTDTGYRNFCVCLAGKLSERIAYDDLYVEDKRDQVFDELERDGSADACWNQSFKAISTKAIKKAF